MAIIDISPELKLKLAKAARDLANEIEAGTAPKLGIGLLFNADRTPCCAMGHVYSRAGLEPTLPVWSDMPVITPDILPLNALMVAYPVENANDSLAPWLKDAPGAARTPLPTVLRDYALAVEGL